MKLFSLFFAITISLCASLCCPEEDDYIDTTFFIDNDEIITIDNNQNEFNVGEYIYIETNITNEQITEDNEVIILSNYDYAEVGQSQYSYSLSLNKQTEYGTSVKIPITFEYIQIVEGNTDINENYFSSDIRIDSYFDGENYKSLIGIKLLEAGNYFISGSYNNIESIYVNGGVYDKKLVVIRSKIVDSNENGLYEFTVN